MKKKSSPPVCISTGYCNDKDVTAVIEVAVSQGGQVFKTSKSRFVMFNGVRVAFAATPSCHRAVNNIKSLLRRAGVKY